ncbi:putative mediator of RNA polymerase II transcription subunit 26 [Coccinella septempunctata]|uniref:putative mediator of RNA polymerase II transcription subunit 26 n=1 Tax=Coccinella septempunctata TaxID=41139 RepID=UPI001D07ABCF|nr:putative mediator of RNA polymerase II transcription subunit 26 [Coccinella septempunctata]
MNTTGNETLERIQREIKENLEKEEEWKRDLERVSNNNMENNNSQSKNNNVPKVNGMLKRQVSETSDKRSFSSQNVNKFIQNVKVKGVMHRFLKSKGKLTASTPSLNGNLQPNGTVPDFTYQPPRVTSETGTLSRNGFVPAEVKMRNEVQEFQKREIELRKERRKSQPELMALLKLEDEDVTKDESYPEFSCSSSTSSASEMKSARSLADLCNTPEEDLDAPGTYNLIKQFENLKRIQ